MSHHDAVVLAQLSQFSFGLTPEECASRTPLSPESVRASYRRLLRAGMVRLVPETADRWQLDTTASI